GAAGLEEGTAAAKRVAGCEHYHRLQDVARARAEAGDLKGALETAGTIEDAGSRDNAVSKVAIARAEAGDLKEAAETAAAGDTEPWRGGGAAGPGAAPGQAGA